MIFKNKIKNCICWPFSIAAILGLGVYFHCALSIGFCSCALEKILQFNCENNCYNDLLVVIATVCATMLTLSVTLGVSAIGDKVQRFVPSIDASDVIEKNLKYICLRYSFTIAIVISCVLLFVHTLPSWLTFALVTVCLLVFFFGLWSFLGFLKLIRDISGDTVMVLLTFFNNQADNILNDAEEKGQ